MESNLGNNRHYSQIIWHTMKEIPPVGARKELILRFKNDDCEMGHAYYSSSSGKYGFYNNDFEDFIYSEDIVAWGEFEFPQDWDYNK